MCQIPPDPNPTCISLSGLLMFEVPELETYSFFKMLFLPHARYSQKSLRPDHARKPMQLPLRVGVGETWREVERRRAWGVELGAHGGIQQ